MILFIGRYGQGNMSGADIVSLERKSGSEHKLHALFVLQIKRSFLVSTFQAIRKCVFFLPVV